AARQEYGLSPIAEPAPSAYDGIILAVAHDRFRRMGASGIRAFGHDPHVLYDLKYVLGGDESDVRL
ncbi:MAG: Vi polysaccharide biosynthesis protein VipA/TviB, partial [Alphaproteobacteria bacterium HGW-Alphaproteobacteria-2]